VLGALDPCVSKVIKFDVIDVKPRFPYHVAFQIHVGYSNYTIKHTFIYEGSKTCVISLTYWKSLGSSTLSQSSTMLTSFDGHSFYPHGIIPTFPVQLGGKTMEVDVKVVDAPLDYNLLLGHHWTYDMTAIISSIFHTLLFPNDGNIMMIDQFSFEYTIPNASIGPSIPMIENSQLETKNIGVGMYSSLMVTFEFEAPIHHIYAMFNRYAS
jgi:hypothetical protein